MSEEKQNKFSSKAVPQAIRLKRPSPFAPNTAQPPNPFAPKKPTSPEGTKPIDEQETHVNHPFPLFGKQTVPPKEQKQLEDNDDKFFRIWYRDFAEKSFVDSYLNFKGLNYAKKVVSEYDGLRIDKTSPDVFDKFQKMLSPEPFTTEMTFIDKQSFPHIDWLPHFNPYVFTQVVYKTNFNFKRDPDYFLFGFEIHNPEDFPSGALTFKFNLYGHSTMPNGENLQKLFIGFLEEMKTNMLKPFASKDSIHLCKFLFDKLSSGRCSEIIEESRVNLQSKYGENFRAEEGSNLQGGSFKFTHDNLEVKKTLLKKYSLFFPTEMDFYFQGIFKRSGNLILKKLKEKFQEKIDFEIHDYNEIDLNLRAFGLQKDLLDVALFFDFNIQEKTFKLGERAREWARAHRVELFCNSNSEKAVTIAVLPQGIIKLSCFKGNNDMLAKAEEEILNYIDQNLDCRCEITDSRKGPELAELISNKFSKIFADNEIHFDQAKFTLVGKNPKKFNAVSATVKKYLLNLSSIEEKITLKHSNFQKLIEELLRFMQKNEDIALGSAVLEKGTLNLKIKLFAGKEEHSWSQSLDQLVKNIEKNQIIEALNVKNWKPTETDLKKELTHVTYDPNCITIYTVSKDALTEIKQIVSSRENQAEKKTFKKEMNPLHLGILLHEKSADLERIERQYDASFPQLKQITEIASKHEKTLIFLAQEKNYDTICRIIEKMVGEIRGNLENLDFDIIDEKLFEYFFPNKEAKEKFQQIAFELQIPAEKQKFFDYMSCKIACGQEILMRLVKAEDLECDVLVVTSNSTMVHQNGLGKLIDDIADQDFKKQQQAQINAKGPIPEGKVCVFPTTPSMKLKLKANNLMFLNCPTQGFIQPSLLSILQTAASKNFKSIGIPPIGCGIFKFQEIETMTKIIQDLAVTIADIKPKNIEKIVLFTNEYDQLKNFGSCFKDCFNSIAAIQLVDNLLPQMHQVAHIIQSAMPPSKINILPQLKSEKDYLRGITWQWKEDPKKCPLGKEWINYDQNKCIFITSQIYDENKKKFSLGMIESQTHKNGEEYEFDLEAGIQTNISTTAHKKRPVKRFLHEMYSFVQQNGEIFIFSSEYQFNINHSFLAGDKYFAKPFGNEKDMKIDFKNKTINFSDGYMTALLCGVSSATDKKLTIKNLETAKKLEAEIVPKQDIQINQETKCFVILTGSKKKIQEFTKTLMEKKISIQKHEMKEDKLNPPDLMQDVITVAQECGVVFRETGSTFKVFGDPIKMATFKKRFEDKKMFYDKPIPYPEYWDHKNANTKEKCVFYRIPVKEDSAEFKKISDLFLGTFQIAKILKIERIQNLQLWRRYCGTIADISASNNNIVDEKHLFHGTNKTKPEEIYSKAGFDYHFASEKNYYGAAAYFSTQAKYSNRYAYHVTDDKGVVTGEKQMFVALVPIGSCVKMAQTDETKKLKGPLER